MISAEQKEEREYNTYKFFKAWAKDKTKTELQGKIAGFAALFRDLHVDYLNLKEENERLKNEKTT